MPAPPAPALARPDRASPNRAYAPRRPEETVLYRTIARGLETFLARARERARPVPRFVEREFRTFLDCGILAHGFLRVRCDACRSERLVAFSCKGRGFCPSCGGRRMAETAAHLVDRVFPVAPVRQWVLTLPWSLRYRMAYDAALTSDLLRELVRALFRFHRERARRRGIPGRLRCGAVTFVQRFGDALNVNVHFHTLALEGVYAEDGLRPERFHVFPPPSDAEVARVVERIVRRIARLLERKGLTDEADPAEVDPLCGDEPLLALLCGASVRGRIATGPRAGQRVLRLGDRIDAEDVEAVVRRAPRCASVAGVSLHANVAVPARDRSRLERLCRYVARPPVATERLERLHDGRLLYRLKRRWRDGTSHVLFEPNEMIEKLAALVPPPRLNLVRYHGVLAPAARGRNRVVPRCLHNAATEHRCGHDARPPGPVAPSATPAPDPRRDAPPESPDDRRPRRYAWAELMRRVFATDVLECPSCQGPMRILAAIHPPETTRAILECLDLPTRPPPVAPAAVVEIHLDTDATDSPQSPELASF